MIVVGLKRKLGCNSLPQLHDQAAMLARERVRSGSRGGKEEGRRERERQGEFGERRSCLCQ